MVAKKKAKSKKKPAVKTVTPSPIVTAAPKPIQMAPNPSNINDSFWSEPRQELEQNAKNPFSDILKKNQMEMQAAKKNKKFTSIILVLILLILLGALIWVLM